LLRAELRKEDEVYTMCSQAAPGTTCHARSQASLDGKVLYRAEHRCRMGASANRRARPTCDQFRPSCWALSLARAPVTLRSQAGFVISLAIYTALINKLDRACLIDLLVGSSNERSRFSQLKDLHLSICERQGRLVAERYVHSRSCSDLTPGKHTCIANHPSEI
jgi:hypothetical protein